MSLVQCNSHAVVGQAKAVTVEDVRKAMEAQRTASAPPISYASSNLDGDVRFALPRCSPAHANCTLKQQQHTNPALLLLLLLLLLL